MNPLLIGLSLCSGPTFTGHHLKAAIDDEVRRSKQKLINEIRAGKHPHLWRPPCKKPSV